MMALHRQGGLTKYEVAAINSETGERIFVAVAPGPKSRSTLRRVLFRELTSKTDTRMARILRMTGCAEFHWARKAADGVIGYLNADTATAWSVKFTGRTALDVDTSRDGEGRSIYSDEAKVAA